jgi:hypothetical protein
MSGKTTTTRALTKGSDQRKTDATGQLIRRKSLVGKSRSIVSPNILQKQLGNRGVQELLSGQESSQHLQAKLMIGQPNDKYEQEAGKVAEKVTRMASGAPCPEYQNQRKGMIQASQISLLIQRQRNVEKEFEQEKEALIQTKTVRTPSEVSPSISAGIQSLQGGGRLLSRLERRFFEPRFQADFSNVRVHSDGRAANLAMSVNARAFTFGRNIVFGAGEYASDTSSGRSLLAHELTHVLQQRHSEAKDEVSNERIQRTSSLCPENWRQTVREDHVRALGMINVARQKLSEYIRTGGVTPREVSLALNLNFGDTSTEYADWVNTSLFFLRGMARSTSYDCEDTNSSWCRSSDIARALWCVPGFDIRVCYPLFFDIASDISRSEVLIHEWHHKYKCGFDLGYVGTSGYPSSTAAAILNADSWSEFVRDLQQSYGD